MTITNNFINLDLYPNKHYILIIDLETGEILEEFNYNYIFWHPFEAIFEKYQKQHLKFDVVGDDGKSTKLFRKYQQTPRGSWVKKPY